MLRELVEMLPPEPTSSAWWICLGGVVVGAALWFMGSRFSRGLFTLVAVTGGAFAGKHVPAWMGWKIDAMAIIVGLALVAGICVFVMHRLWVGTAFGLVLALWTATAMWIVMHKADWQWPASSEWSGISNVAEQLWAQFPTDMQRIMPYFCAGAFISGFSMMLLWPRIGISLFYSVMGTTIGGSLGLTMLNGVQRGNVARFNLENVLQLTWLIVIVLLGAIIQWRMMPSSMFAKAKKDEPEASPLPLEQHRARPMSRMGDVTSILHGREAKTA